MISFIEIFNKGGYKSWGIREVSINPSLIIKMQEDDEIESHLEQGFLPKEIEKTQRFTKIFFTNDSYLTVISPIDISIEKIAKANNTGRTLLKG